MIMGSKKSNVVNEFVELSRYVGGRFDLVQAGGGNTSVKLDDRKMLIKASGIHLSEIEEGKGYVEVDYVRLAKIADFRDTWIGLDKGIRDSIVLQHVEKCTFASQKVERASIEVFMHAVLGRFVLHAHPISVNAISCGEDWEEIFTDLFPKSLCIPYFSPGIELGIELSDRLQVFRSNFGVQPELIFLQNHGLLVTGESQEAVQSLTEAVVLTCEDFCNIDLGRYRNSSALASYFGEGFVAYLSEDQELLDLHRSLNWVESQRPLYPDSFVFCGLRPMILENIDSQASLREYEKNFQTRPKIVIFRGQLYFIARSVRKAREIEEIYKAHALVLTSLPRGPIHLSEDELAYLGNWEAEKYREEK